MEDKPSITASPVASSSLFLILNDQLLPSRTLERRFWPLLLSAAYLLLVAKLGGLRSDHLAIGALVLLDFYNETSRKFLKYFFPFILTGVVFDSMRYFYWQGIEGHVHVSEPYFRDLAWFGIGGITPNEFFVAHPSTALDIMCGFAYLVFVGEYLVAALYLFFDRKFYWLKRFGWSFLTVNALGFITYFIYPAAPPWYVSQYGLGPVRMDVQPTAAAAVRFDKILGTHFFDQIYSRGVDVFGAYPSLHVAYPFLVVLVSFQVARLKAFRAPAIAFYFLMCLSAVYLQHHYVFDIILGTIYAASTWLITGLVFSKRPAEGLIA